MHTHTWGYVDSQLSEWAHLWAHMKQKQSFVGWHSQSYVPVCSSATFCHISFADCKICSFSAFSLLFFCLPTTMLCFYVFNSLPCFFCPCLSCFLTLLCFTFSKHWDGGRHCTHHKTTQRFGESCLRSSETGTIPKWHPEPQRLFGGVCVCVCSEQTNKLFPFLCAASQHTCNIPGQTTPCKKEKKEKETKDSLLPLNKDNPIQEKEIVFSSENMWTWMNADWNRDLSLFSYRNKCMKRIKHLKSQWEQIAHGSTVCHQAFCDKNSQSNSHTPTVNNRGNTQTDRRQVAYLGVTPPCSSFFPVRE